MGLWVGCVLLAAVLGIGRGVDPWTATEDPSRLRTTDSVFLCGRRATVEVFLPAERGGKTAFSPLDAFNELQVRLAPAPVLESVRVSPLRVEKRWAFGEGGSVTSTWQVDAVRPLLRVEYDFQGPAEGELRCRLWAGIASNVGYVNKFVQHDDDTAAVEDGVLTFHDRERPHLGLRAWMVPRAGAARLDSPPEASPERQSGSLETEVAVAAGRTRRLVLWVAASDSPAELESLSRPGRLEAGPLGLQKSFSFHCPDPGLEEFVRACCATIALNVRNLPFGPPFSPQGTANERWPVLTASPDYHGIFANDCLQTLWEAGLLGQGLREAARNSVESMLRYGPHESVEWWTGDGRVWSFTAPLGDTPQVVMGACWHLLWTGDRELAERWWPHLQRCLAVLGANDADGDGLEDRPNTPYPEQPDPGTYNHEMLYVQCFWHQAFLRAAAVAEWLGKPEAGAYRERAARIAEAIESRFATDYGLGVWLNRDHEPHPHIGHEQILAAEQGDVSDERARRILRTVTSAPIWTPDGPLRAEPGKGVAAGDHVWTFMRWKLVLALFRLGETDRALDLARRWAEQERSLRYQAPEGFPTITGTTGKAYTWSASRALRALVFGLSGLSLEGRGVRFAPRLPSAWDRFRLDDLPIQGARVSLAVRRGLARVLIDGREVPGAFLPYTKLRRGRVRVEVWVP